MFQLPLADTSANNHGPLPGEEDKSILLGPRDLNNTLTAFIIYLTNYFSAGVITSLEICKIQRIECHHCIKTSSTPIYFHTGLVLLCFTDVACFTNGRQDPPPAERS